MIVEHRRVILQTPDENAKIGIVRSSHDNRRPNVTYALVIVVIDVRMSLALRPLDNLTAPLCLKPCIKRRNLDPNSIFPAIQNTFVVSAEK